MDYFGVDETVAVRFIESLQKHLEYVREAGTRLGIPLEQLAEHDTSKFSVFEYHRGRRGGPGRHRDCRGFAGPGYHDPIGQRRLHMKFIVNLWLDGYETEEEMETTCLEFIRERLDMAASCVSVTRYLEET